jgi:asparagine synthase (glutamine-hydrolysing)
VRFVGIVSLIPEARRTFAEGLGAQDESKRALHIALQTETLMLATDGIGKRDLSPGQGSVFGRLAQQHGALEPGMLAEPTARLIYCSQGEELVRRYWGGYLAFLTAQDGAVQIVRAPLGDLPCYFWTGSDQVLLSSSPRLLTEFLCAGAQVDWLALGRHLAFGTIHTNATCLAGIQELAGGERLTIAGGRVQRTALWSPWPFVARDAALLNPHDAALRLRSTAVDCVCTSASGYERVLLKLSGGLDSSIVAACLAEWTGSTSAITLMTDEPAGDQRLDARAVAQHLRFSLSERRRDPERINIAQSPAADLARPSIPGFRQESDRLCEAAAAAAGAAAVVDGGGGDNLFCSLQSAAPVADCLVTREGRRHTLRTAASIAALAHVSGLEVLKRGAARALARRNSRWPVDRSLLSAELSTAIPAQPSHPWLCSPPGTLPGRAAHVALLAAAQSYVEGLNPDRNPPLIAPLLSQPLVELCLRIPSWLWFDQGLNRAAARRAFAGDLPQATLGRRSKGSPEPFVAQMLERHAHTVREWLLDGILAEHGLLDRHALSQVLQPGRPPSDRDLQRVSSLLDAEVWARGWIS